jgi:hypothetical protein
MILAVHESRLPRRLRHLAQTLAVFANDAGGDIYPGMDTLAQALGTHHHSAIYAQLRDLQEIGVLHRDGYRRHTRRFKFDVERLSGYVPETELSREKPSTLVEGSEARSGGLTLHRRTLNPPAPHTQPSTSTHLTLHAGAPDLKDLQEDQDQTAAAAAGRSQTPKTPSPDDVPFRVYAAMFSKALELAAQEGDPSHGNEDEHFKRLCVQQHRPCDRSIVQRAGDAARAARDHKPRLAALKARLQASGPASAEPRGRRRS